MSDRMGPDGYPTVVHAAKIFGKRVVETTMEDFALMRVGPIDTEGYPGLLSPQEVVTRARSQIETPWRLWKNCEHFVAWCHGLPETSPQLRTKLKRAAGTTGVIIGALLIGRFR